MKKLLAAALVAVVITFTFVNCGNSDEQSASFDEITLVDESSCLTSDSLELGTEEPLTVEETPEETLAASPSIEATQAPTAKPTAKPTAAATKKPIETVAPVKNTNFAYYNPNFDINDNVFLDALEYTGYNLKKHRADGRMWEFIHGKYKAGMGYLSGLGYSGNSSGYETNSLGLPDIARIKKKGGLVCASYVTYVYFNYLPNVAGIDTSSLPKPTNPCAAQSWRLTAEKWVEMGYSSKIGFKATRRCDGIINFTPEQEIPVGSLVVFKVHDKPDSANARHVAIYAGHAGGYHWMTHVGNERGPEMITIERMGFGSTPELPLMIVTPPTVIKK